jgi:ribosome-associated heat shock protein Hsp15
MPRKTSEEPVRVDKWLWAARFYKTRSLAAQAVEGGKVHLNGERVKRSKAVQVGDQIRIRQGTFQYDLQVLGVSGHRGPAKVAALLYQETAESRHARELMATQLRMARVPVYEGKGRPTKRDRRLLERIKDDAG